MRKYSTIDLIDINKKKGFPRVYRFNPFVRWLTILFAMFAIFYAIWYVFAAVDADTPTFRKIIPFIIIFFAGNSLFRNLFSLNSVHFFQDRIIFRYILMKSVSIAWLDVTKLMLYQGKSRAIQLGYREGDNNRLLIFTMSFPNLLEIVNSISELCPNLELDEFMKSVIITDKERQKIEAEKSNQNHLDKVD